MGGEPWLREPAHPGADNIRQMFYRFAEHPGIKQKKELNKPRGKGTSACCVEARGYLDKFLEGLGK